ncbi:hypothetical protein VHEMI00168 [[Torrubiella] hemipterigena]|uniref:Extracellular serine-rich protein n=1 Tax=[Torrubiella] hemipterigena TaxID=1531966 RepID=A0A0A1T3N8_9HYPO|nr:hypothetical protein VHEMI00168 [[Torrubiella] hemipterigena]
MKFSALSVAAIAGLAQAAEVQVVSVGKNPVNGEVALKYFPEKITAKPGTMVQFQFLGGNHTVTQSNFDNPCIPLHKADSSKQNFASGFQPVAAGESKGQLPVFTIKINDTKPIWVYCGQGPHCMKGMAMVINEASNTTKTLEEYKKKAAGTAPAGGSPPASGGQPPAGTQVGQPSASGGSSAPPATSSQPVVAGASTIGVSATMLLALGSSLLFL